MFHTFDTEVATQFKDTNIATLFQNLCYWIIHNKTNEKNRKTIEIEGKNVERYFTFNSISAFSKQFPYFSKKQIENYLNKLRDSKLIVKANFNEKGFDRTSWFCLVDEDYWMKRYLGAETVKTETPESGEEPENEESGNGESNPEEGEIDNVESETSSHGPETGNAFPQKGKCISSKGEMDIPKTGNAFPQKGKWISPNGEMDIPKTGNAFPENGRPIPDINSYPKPDFKQNTAASVQEALHEIDPTLILDREFYPAAAVFLNNFKLDKKYLRWFYEGLKNSKKITNVHGYFFKVFFRDVYAARYKAFCDEQNKQKDIAHGQELIYDCPVCQKRQHVGKETIRCESCGTPINPTQEEIKKFRKLFVMDEATKERYIFARSKVTRSGGNVTANLAELDKQFGIVS